MINWTRSMCSHNRIKEEGCENLLRGQNMGLSNPPGGLCGDRSLDEGKKSLCVVRGPLLELIFFLNFNYCFGLICPGSSTTFV